MTVKIDTTARIEKVRFQPQGAFPAGDPESGYGWLYFVTGTANGGMYFENDAGMRIGPFITGSSGSGFTNGAASVVRLTSGDVTISSTSATGSIAGLSDITLAAATGDMIEIGICARQGNTTAQSMRFDFATIVGGAITNYVSTLSNSAASNGLGAFFCAASVAISVGGSVFYQAQAGDISGGNIVLRVICWVSASTRAINANTNDPFIFFAKNLKQ